MAKKVNGIKIYPKYSFASIATAILLMVCVAAVAIVAFFPIISYKLGGTEYSLTGLEYLNYVLNTNKFAPLNFLNSFVEFKDTFFNVRSDFTPTLGITSWYKGDIPSYIDLGVAGCLVLLVIVTVFIAIKAILSLIIGFYPKHTKFLTFLASLFGFFFIVCLFGTNLIYNYVLKEYASTNSVSVETTLQGWAYIAWAAIFISWILIGFIKKSIVSGKLYIPKARKIAKSNK